MTGMVPFKTLNVADPLALAVREGGRLARLARDGGLDRGGDRPRRDRAGHLLRADADLHADVLRRDASRPARQRRRALQDPGRRRPSSARSPAPPSPRCCRSTSSATSSRSGRCSRSRSSAPASSSSAGPAPTSSGRSASRASGSSPPLGIVFAVALMATLPVTTWIRLGVWLAIGLVIYFTYARRRTERADGQPARGGALSPSRSSRLDVGLALGARSGDDGQADGRPGSGRDGRQEAGTCRDVIAAALIAAMTRRVHGSLRCAAGAAASVDTGKYVSLGDSYTAGPLVLNQTGTPIDCARSDHNYPSLVAARPRRRRVRRRQLQQRRDQAHDRAADRPAARRHQPAAVRRPDRTDAVSSRSGSAATTPGSSASPRKCAQLGLTAPTGTACRDHYAPGGVDSVEAKIEADRARGSTRSSRESTTAARRPGSRSSATRTCSRSTAPTATRWCPSAPTTSPTSTR